MGLSHSHLLSSTWSLGFIRAIRSIDRSYSGVELNHQCRPLIGQGEFCVMREMCCNLVLCVLVNWVFSRLRVFFHMSGDWSKQRLWKTTAVIKPQGHNTLLLSDITNIRLIFSLYFKCHVLHIAVAAWCICILMNRMKFHRSFFIVVFSGVNKSGCLQEGTVLNMECEIPKSIMFGPCLSSTRG